MAEQQLMQMKVAILESLKEAGEIGPEASKKRVMENKVGVLEALQQSGLAKGMQQPQKDDMDIDINYKDAPPDVQRQMEQKAGFAPSKQIAPSTTEQMLSHAKAVNELNRPAQEREAADMALRRQSVSGKARQ